MSWKSLVVIGFLVLLVTSTSPPAAVRAQQQEQPVVGGVPLVRSQAGEATLFHDPDVSAATVKTASDAIAVSIADVPPVTGLPRFSTPIVAYVLADDDRFRLALSEIARVRVELVADEIAGYTIERDGVMLIFFTAPNVATSENALAGFSHELAHLAVRELTQRRALPQWFNEGYASWISTGVLDQRGFASAPMLRQLDRLAVVSALHTRGLLPWADLVTRARFSRAGVDGLANLAYGQSTLFVDFLATRHGEASPVTFLRTLGEGTAATPAFTRAFGAQFGPESAAFEATLEPLKTATPPGLYVVGRTERSAALVLAVVGGPPKDAGFVEVLVNGELVRQRELDFDGAGLLVTSIPESLVRGQANARIRVRAPDLGTLELDPATQTSVHATPRPSVGPTATPPAPSPMPQPAPAQVPARSSHRPGLDPPRAA